MRRAAHSTTSLGASQAVGLCDGVDGVVDGAHGDDVELWGGGSGSGEVAGWDEEQAGVAAGGSDGLRLAPPISVTCPSSVTIPVPTTGRVGAGMAPSCTRRPRASGSPSELPTVPVDTMGSGFVPTSTWKSGRDRVLTSTLAPSGTVTVWLVPARVIVISNGARASCAAAMLPARYSLTVRTG